MPSMLYIKIDMLEKRGGSTRREKRMKLPRCKEACVETVRACAHARAHVTKSDDDDESTGTRCKQRVQARWLKACEKRGREGSQKRRRAAGGGAPWSTREARCSPSTMRFSPLPKRLLSPCADNNDCPSSLARQGRGARPTMNHPKYSPTRCAAHRRGTAY